LTAAGASGGASGGRMRSYSKQKSGLVAAAAAATGDAAGDACFDPISAHRWGSCACIHRQCASSSTVSLWSNHPAFVPMAGLLDWLQCSATAGQRCLHQE
jgi:hypothetical protein